LENGPRLRARSSPATAQFLETAASIPQHDTGPQADARFKAELPKWDRLVKAARASSRNKLGAARPESRPAAGGREYCQRLLDLDKELAKYEKAGRPICHLRLRETNESFQASVD
jgi:hypothetical protein